MFVNMDFTLIQVPKNETELLTVTENECEVALNDTVAENNGFVAPNNDYVTLAQINC